MLDCVSVCIFYLVLELSVLLRPKCFRKAVLELMQLNTWRIGMRPIPWKNNRRIDGNYLQLPYTTLPLPWLIDLPLACLQDAGLLRLAC